MKAQVSTAAQAVAAGDQAALTAALRADFLRNHANIPDALKRKQVWVVWRLTAIDTDRGKFGKVPYYPGSGHKRHGQQGSVDDRAALATWDDAFRAFMADASIAGVGVAMLPEFGMVALDADGCVTHENGQPIVAGSVKALCGTTYAELSPSGSGVRAFWLGKATDGKNLAEGIELFHGKGFVTVTGNRLSGTCPEALSPHLGAQLQAKVAARPSMPQREPTELQRLTRQMAATESVLAELRDALAVIPADDRDLWVRMGHALKTLGDAAEGIWHEWSAKSAKYDLEDADRAWQSFEPTQTGHGAIFAEAKRRGWKGRSLVADLQSATPDPVALDLRALPQEPPPVPFIIPGWLPANVVTLFAAHGGAGKSFIALYLAICLAAGLNPFERGERIPRRRVLLYSAEDGLPVLEARLRRYLDHMAISPDDLAGWLTVLDATASDNVLFRADRTGGATTNRYEWLRGEVQSFGADLLIFDNASDAMDANENDRAAVRQFMSALRNVAPTVLLLAHVDAASSMARQRDAKGYSGSTAWHNSARSRWLLTKDADGTLTLTQPKVNYGRAGSEVLLKWDDAHGVFIVTDCFAQAPSGEAFRPQLLALLATALDEGQTISPHPTANNNAAKIIRSMPSFPARLGRPELRKEIDDWQRLGLVRVERYRTDGRKPAERLMLTKAGRAMAAGDVAPLSGSPIWNPEDF